MPNINQAYNWAVNTCNAPNVGYSQSYRNQQTVGGVTYYDCSSFINYALLAGGWTTPSYAPRYNSFTTYTMASELLRLGFTEVSATGIWKPGDIGLSSGHTEMVYSGGTGGGVCMGAHTNQAPLSGQVSIGSSSGNTGYVSTYNRFPRLFRYGNGATGGNSESESTINVYVVAAMCGNFWQESHVDPGIYESLKVVPLKDNSVYGGYGLGQWTNSTQYGVYRRTALAQWLDDNGYAYDSGEGQIKFLLHENYWTSNGYASQFSSLQDFLNSDSTDLQSLTYAYQQGWEGIWNSTHTLRYQFAQKALAYIQQHANDSSITTWITGNRYLSESEALHNCVLIFRLLSGGGGGGGTVVNPGILRTKLPVYAMIRNRRLF